MKRYVVAVHLWLYMNGPPRSTTVVVLFSRWTNIYEDVVKGAGGEKIRTMDVIRSGVRNVTHHLT